jgi:hypothetical protein
MLLQDLQTSCNKVVVKPIPGCVRTSCSQLLWQVWNKLLSPSWLITKLMTVTDLLQVVPTRLIRVVRNKLLWAFCHQLVTCRRYQTCWNNLLRVCWPRQPYYKMITTCSRLVNNWEQAVRTHPVDRLWDFYACKTHNKKLYNRFCVYSVLTEIVVLLIKKTCTETFFLLSLRTR